MAVISCSRDCAVPAPISPVNHCSSLGHSPAAGVERVVRTDNSCANSSCFYSRRAQPTYLLTGLGEVAFAVESAKSPRSRWSSGWP